MPCPHSCPCEGLVADVTDISVKRLKPEGASTPGNGSGRMAGGGKALRLLEKASAVLAAAASPVFSALTRPAADPGQFGAALALVVGMLAFCAGLVLALKKACGTVCV